MTMEKTEEMKNILKLMSDIQWMEKGKISQMGKRPFYNHQVWEKGRNVVRYVPVDQKEFIQSAIEGYDSFMKLAELYVQKAIEITRKEQGKRFPKKKSKI